MANQINNKLIARNTAVLYLRMLFTLAVSLFTTRELLRILGVEDFGLYNVVGGVVLIFGFLNNAMIASSQRYISFALGEGNIDRQNKVFSTSVLIHLTIAIVILLFAETIGLWFLNNKMTIPNDRIETVNWVYHAAIASFFFQILQVPFSSSVIAHEKMSYFAIVSVLDSVLKLGIVYVLSICSVDKLKLYALLLLGVSLFNLLLYLFYTKIKFEECKFKLHFDIPLYKEMLSFAGWSFVGNFGVSVKDYGVNILLNIFCGPEVNAARGIAYQVMNAVNGFVSNFQTAMNPQITKRYAIGSIDSMISLIRNGCRYSFYLLSIIVIPLFIRSDYVLSIWLDRVPDLTIQFLRLALLMAMVNSMSGPLVIAMHATGKIQVFQITIALILSLDIPISYLLLKYGFSPYSVMFSAIMTALIGLIARTILLNRLIKIDVKKFILNVIFRNFIIGFIMYIPAFFISRIIPLTFTGLLLFCIISILWSLIVIFISLSKSEKETIVTYIYSFISVRRKTSDSV